jgi:hypothetical protein
MTYIPQPGTVPHRIINWLKLQPIGAEYSSAVLAEELGIEQSHVGPCLQAPMRHGAITARKDGRLMMFSLGDGIPLCTGPDHELDEPLLPDKEVLVERELKARAVQPLIKAVSTPLAQQPRAPKEPVKEASGIRVPVFLQEDAPRTEPDIATAVTDWQKHYTPADHATIPVTEAAVTAPAKAFRIGEFSDGTLVLERGKYDRYELSAAEAKVLLDFVFESCRVAA